jgi:hypothetical protein
LSYPEKENGIKENLTNSKNKGDKNKFSEILKNIDKKYALKQNTELRHTNTPIDH